MYSKQQVLHALELLKEMNGNTRAVIRTLGYPSKYAKMLLTDKITVHK